MASRLPVVLSDLPAIRELVDDGDGALIVPQRDPAAVAAAVVRLLEDGELSARFGDRNRAVVCERADAARETDRCIELYRQLSRR